MQSSAQNSACCITTYCMQDTEPPVRSSKVRCICNFSITLYFLCRATLRSFYNAIYMLGMLLGSYVFGWISDKHGRMKALLIAVMTVSLSGFFG